MTEQCFVILPVASGVKRQEGLGRGSRSLSPSHPILETDVFVGKRTVHWLSEGD